MVKPRGYAAQDCSHFPKILHTCKIHFLKHYRRHPEIHSHSVFIFTSYQLLQGTQLPQMACVMLHVTIGCIGPVSYTHLTLPTNREV